MKVNFYNEKLNKSTKDISIPLSKDGVVNQELLSTYVRVFDSNARQANAQTKSRGDVSGGGKKPWRQKGTGRARAGSTRSPVWVGGGVVHGPKMANYKLKISKRAKATLFSQVVAHKIKSSNLSVVNFDSINKPSTKKILEVIKKVTESNNTSVLIVTNNEQNVVISARNIQNAESASISEINSRDILKSNYILISEKSLPVLQDYLK